MIVRGYIKEILEFYLVKKPLFNLKNKKEDQITNKNQFKPILSIFNFLLLYLKEKSLYNITSAETIEIGGGP